LDVHPIILSAEPLPWKKEIFYLGLVITTGRKFADNFQDSVQKFVRALNGIFGKVCFNSSPEVLSSLIHAYCLPVLLYDVETINLFSRVLNGLEKNLLARFYENL